MAPQTACIPDHVVAPSHYSIRMGPGKLDLAYALMTRGHVLTFQVENLGAKELWKVELIGLEEMDDEKNSFKFKFRLVSSRPQDGTTTKWSRHPCPQNYSVHGWYHVNAHEGSVQVVLNQG